MNGGLHGPIPEDVEQKLQDASDLAQVDNIENLTLLQRIQAIREKVGYIRKTKTGEGTPYKSAVSHSSVLEKLRPWLVKYQICWWPSKAEMLEGWHGVYPVRNGERLFVFARIKTTIIFACADKPPTSLDVIHVEVITDGMDDQDKGGPKASTYADKLALLRLFNLESGDDPDFDRAAEVGLDDETQGRIDRIRGLIERHPHYKDDPAAYERGTLVQWKQKHSRYRVPTIAGLPDEALDTWAETLEREIAEIGHG